MKKIINIALAAAVLTGAAVTAQAADTDIYMYGASAQRDYWKDLGSDFLTATVADGGLGCTSAHKAQADSNYVIIKGVGCSATGGDVYINYSSVASIEGVRASLALAPNDSSLNDTCGGNNAMREVANKTTCTWPAWPSVGTCSTTKTCADITAGTSDVEVSSFTQESHGQLNGQVGGGWKDYVLTGSEDVSAMVHYKPTIVPFAFYANNELGSAQPVGDLANFTRTQAVNLFSGKIATWDMLKGFEAFGDEVQLCLRHAGSGTHATLDKAVFRDDTKDAGLTLVTTEETGTAPYAYFYQSSSKAAPSAGMKECIETNGGNGLFSGVIAVGYLDADTANTLNLHQMMYQGSPAVDAENRAAGLTNDYINKGSYDFWSAQNVYVSAADNTTAFQKLMAFAEGHIPASKAGQWTTKNDLQVEKASDLHLPMQK